MANFIISAEILSLLVMLIIGAGISGQARKKTSPDLFFIVSLGFLFIGELFDSFTYIFEGNPAKTGLLTASNYIAIVAGDFFMAMFAYYIWATVNEKQECSRLFADAVALISAIDFANNTIGTFTHSVFVMKDAVFVEGPLYIVYELVEVVLLFAAAIYLYTKRNILGKKTALIIGTYVFFPVISIIIGIVFPGAYFTYVAMTMVLLINYIMLVARALEDSSIREQILMDVMNTDELTGLKNRRAFMESMEKADQDADYGVVFCDLNGLKSINDTYGHIRGDKYLTDFSEILHGAFEGSEIFRVSGDEFVVFYKNGSEDGFDMKYGRLCKQCKDRGNISSIGASYGKGREIVRLVVKAENRMYEEKQRYYKEKGSPNR